MYLTGTSGLKWPHLIPFHVFSWLSSTISHTPVVHNITHAVQPTPTLHEPSDIHLISSSATFLDTLFGIDTLFGMAAWPPSHNGSVVYLRKGKCHIAQNQSKTILGLTEQEELDKTDKSYYVYIRTCMYLRINNIHLLIRPTLPSKYPSESLNFANTWWPMTRRTRRSNGSFSCLFALIHKHEYSHTYVKICIINEKSTHFVITPRSNPQYLRLWDSMFAYWQMFRAKPAQWHMP